MVKQILELITVGAKLFSKERALYFIKKAEGLQKIVERNEDADFYNKDMNAKAKAERELEKDTHKLRLEFLAEARKWET